MSSSSRYIFALVFILWQEGTCDVSITTHHADAPDGPEGPRNTHTTSMKRFKMKNSHVESTNNCFNSEAITEGSGFPFELKRCLEITLECIRVNLKNAHKDLKFYYNASGYIHYEHLDKNNHTKFFDIIKRKKESVICSFEVFYGSIVPIDATTKAVVKTVMKAPFFVPKPAQMINLDVDSVTDCKGSEILPKNREGFPFDLRKCPAMFKWEKCLMINFYNEYLISSVSYMPGWTLEQFVDPKGFTRSMILNVKGELPRNCKFSAFYQAYRLVDETKGLPNRLLMRLHIDSDDHTSATPEAPTKTPLQEESTMHFVELLLPISLIILLSISGCLYLSYESSNKRRSEILPKKKSIKTTSKVDKKSTKEQSVIDLKFIPTDKESNEKSSETKGEHKKSKIKERKKSLKSEFEKKKSKEETDEEDLKNKNEFEKLKENEAKGIEEMEKINPDEAEEKLDNDVVTKSNEQSEPHKPRKKFKRKVKPRKDKKKK